MKKIACALAFLALFAGPGALAKKSAPAPASQTADAAPKPQAAPKPPAPPAPAPDQAPIGPELDKSAGALKQIEAGLDRRDLADADLQALRQKLDPVSASAASAIERLTPRLAAIQTRLDQLGPKPADGDLPESPEVTADRDDQQKNFNETQELLKRARLIAVQADQTAALITARRRALFTQSLFERATSILSPSLWTAVWTEAPDYFAAARKELTDWVANINDQLDGRRARVFWGAILAVALLYAPFAAVTRRLYGRNRAASEPTRLQKILGVWWIFLRIALPAVATVYLVGAIFDAFNLTNQRLQPLMQALAGGVIRVALVAGLARGILAPTRPNWRLPRFGDALSDQIARLAISVAAIVSLTRVFEAMNELIGASLAFSVALRGAGVLLAAITLAAGLWTIGSTAETDDRLGSPVTEERDWFSLLRVFCWIVAIVDFVSVLSGYASFASFVLDQLVWVGGVCCILFMATMLAEEAIGASFKPTTRLGRRLNLSLGFHANSIELLGALIAGAIRLGLIMTAVALILAPWGLQSADVPLDLGAAFFGFKVGDVTISLSSIIIAAAIFGLAYAIVHAVQGWIDSRLLPHTNLDAGLRNSIKTSLGYAGFLVAVSLALSYLGLSLEKLALLAGALSVGIGFGLQSIVNNFVSGLILLWERAVRVGDWIVVGSDQGYVRRINIRSTEIETFDRSQVIIPNSNLVSGIVKNLVRNDRTGRLLIPLTVSGSADPLKVREVLLSVVKSHDLVLKIPAPQILFTSMSADALTFDLAVFVGDVEILSRVRSDLHFQIFEKFVEEKLLHPPAADPTKIEIAGIENIDSLREFLSNVAPAMRSVGNG